MAANFLPKKVAKSRLLYNLISRPRGGESNIGGKTIIDAFLITSTADEVESSIAFQILERRSEARKSTIMCSQRNPNGWAEMLSGDEVVANAIVKRSTRHYTILISKNSD